MLNDFLGETYAKNQKLDTLSMENVSATLQHCLSLVNSKYEAHSITGIKASGNIFNVFRDVLLSFLNNFYRGSCKPRLVLSMRGLLTWREKNACKDLTVSLTNSKN